MNTLKQPQPPIPSTQSGFTLIECLLAIIIVSVLLVAIAPAVVISTATRLQARRVELATQAARTYVDGVRSGSIATPNFIVVLNELNTVTNQDGTTSKVFDSKRDIFSQVAAPPAIAITSCPNATPQPSGSVSAQSDYCFNKPQAPFDNQYYSLYCVNLDGSGCIGSNNRGSKNMIVQAFRSASSSTDTGSGGYILGVRVYRLDSFDGSGTLLQKTQNTQKRMATFTGGVGDRKSPLVELTTEIAPASQNDPSGRWKELCKRLGGAGCPQ